MSGERVGVIKDRATAFLDLAAELMERDRLDIASFCVHQACQLRIKATLLRVTGDIPRIHGVRELLGMLAKGLEELGYPKDSEAVIRFARENRDLLVDVEAAYTESRYGLATATKMTVKAMVKATKLLFVLLEGVERDVLG